MTRNPINPDVAIDERLNPAHALLKHAANRAGGASPQQPVADTPANSADPAQQNVGQALLRLAKSRADRESAPRRD